MGDFSGGVTLKRGDGAGTEVFTKVPGMLVAPVLGQTNELIEVSDYDSVEAKEYIAAFLGDGNEVDIEFNYDISDTQQQGVLADIKDKLNRNYEMIVTNGTDTISSAFTLVPLGWNRTPSFTEQHKLSARFKISGAITDVIT